MQWVLHLRQRVPSGDNHLRLHLIFFRFFTRPADPGRAYHHLSHPVETGTPPYGRPLWRRL